MAALTFTLLDDELAAIELLDKLETELALEGALLATDELEDGAELDDCVELTGTVVELLDDELPDEELATEVTLTELLLEDVLLATDEPAELTLDATDAELADNKLLLDDELTTAGAELAAGGGEELLPPPPQAERTLTKERLKIREPARIKASL